MTDAPTATTTAHSPHQPEDIPLARTEGLGVLSLSTPSEAQPEFDPATALVAAATAEDGSVEEIVLLRLLVLRRAHPDAIVRTHLERVEDDQVVLRAEVTLSTGASASAYATAGGGVASIERTEHRALGRALDALGEAVLVDISRKGDESLAPAPEAVGRDDSSDAIILPDLDDDTWEDEEEPAFDPPTATSSPHAPEPEPERDLPPSRFSPPPPPGRATPRPEPDYPESPPSRPAGTTPPPPAVVDAVRRANLRRHGTAPQADRTPIESDAPEEIDATTASPSSPSRHLDDVTTEPDEPPLENYSWTAFWRVARPLGLDKMKVEQIIGTPITSLTPLQVRERLQAEGVDI
ncbi:MAG: hypothetical protein ACTHMX_05750 [Thermomicrobiales bacterium]